MNEPTPILAPDSLYSGDNGHIFCGSCAGGSAKYTGYDLSGMKVAKLTSLDAELFTEFTGAVMQCETCKKTLEDTTQ